MECVRAAGCDRSNFNADRLEHDAADPRRSFAACRDRDRRATRERALGEGRPADLLGDHRGRLGPALRTCAGRRRRTVARRLPQLLRSRLHRSERRIRPLLRALPAGRPLPALGDDRHRLARGRRPHARPSARRTSGRRRASTEAAGKPAKRGRSDTDNTPPAAPLSLAIGSANPARYLPTFSASWGLASDPGSPITKVHWWITDAAGNVVVPEQVVAAIEPDRARVDHGAERPGRLRAARRARGRSRLRRTGRPPWRSRTTRRHRPPRRTSR